MLIDSRPMARALFRRRPARRPHGVPFPTRLLRPGRHGNAPDRREFRLAGVGRGAGVRKLALSPLCAPTAVGFRRPRAGIRFALSGGRAPPMSPHRMPIGRRRPRSPSTKPGVTGSKQPPRRNRREILSAAFQTAPQFRIDGAADSPHEDSAPQLSRSDQPNVRFTRTPEASIARRKAEEEAQRRAVEEAAPPRRRGSPPQGRGTGAPARGNPPRAIPCHRRPETPGALRPHAGPRDAGAQWRQAAARAGTGCHAAAPVSAAPVPAVPVAAAPATGFNAFAAMGARFSFSVGFGGISAPAQAAAPAPARPLAAFRPRRLVQP